MIAKTEMVAKKCGWRTGVDRRPAALPLICPYLAPLESRATGFNSLDT